MTSQNLFDLTGKVAVVTGGNGGIGLGIAMGLAGAGANIVIAARSVEKTAQALEDIRALGVEAHGITVDVTQEPAIQRMVTSTIDHMGRLDILVNNSGIAVRAQPQELTSTVGLSGGCESSSCFPGIERGLRPNGQSRGRQGNQRWLHVFHLRQ